MRRRRTWAMRSRTRSASTGRRSSSVGCTRRWSGRRSRASTRTRATWERPFLEFADDNTFVRKGWSQELLEAMKPLDLQWFTETDISLADDVDAVQALADSGCKQVLIGLESVKSSVLDGIDARNWKL